MPLPVTRCLVVCALVGAMLGCGSPRSPQPPAPHTSDAGIADVYDRAACERDCERVISSESCADVVDGATVQAPCPCSCP